MLIDLSFSKTGHDSPLSQEMVLHVEVVLFFLGIPTLTNWIYSGTQAEPHTAATALCLRGQVLAGVAGIKPVPRTCRVQFSDSSECLSSSDYVVGIKGTAVNKREPLPSWRMLQGRGRRQEMDKENVYFESWAHVLCRKVRGVGRVLLCQARHCVSGALEEGSWPVVQTS